MKKFTVIVAIWLFLGASAMGFPAQANMFKAAAGSCPVINGAIDSWWDSYDWVSLGKTVQGQVQESDEFSASFKTAYSDAGLYLLVKVIDDSMNASPGPDRYFDADSITIFLDFNDDRSAATGQDDLQLSLVYGHGAIFSREGMDTQAIHKAWGTVTGGYVLEMYVPYDAVSQRAITDGSKLGFDILVNDVGADGAHKGMVGWSGDDSDFSSSASLGELFACAAERTFTVEAHSSAYQDMTPGSLQGVSFLETMQAKTGRAVFRFNDMEPGLYYAWVKVQAPDSSSGGFAAAFDNENDASRATAVTFGQSDDFQWVSTRLVELSVDSIETHSFSVFGTNRYAKLSKVFLTNNPLRTMSGLARPAITTLEVKSSTVRVCWTAPESRAKWMIIERGNANGEEFSEIAKVDAQSCAYDDSSVILQDGIGYRIRTASENDGSAYSAMKRLVYRLPKAPENVTLVSVNGVNNLSWSDPQTGVDGYQVEMRIDNKEYATLAWVRGTQRQYAHFESAYLSRFYKLRYRMRAHNAAGYSPYAYPPTEDDLVRDVGYSNGNSDVFIVENIVIHKADGCMERPGNRNVNFKTSDVDAIFQDKDATDQKSHFMSLPSYLVGTDYLRSFYNDARSEEREYMSFLAHRSLRMYLAVDHDAEVNRDVWILKERGVPINPVHYPNGVDIYCRSVVKGARVILQGNGILSRGGNQFLVFVEEDSTALIKINFGPSRTQQVEGYDLDYGAVYSTKSSGLSYGWQSATDSRAGARLGDDPLIGTFIEIPPGNSWKISLPDGQYRVRLCIGDDWYYTPEEVTINSRSYSFDEDRGVVGEKHHLTIEDVFTVSGLCKNALVIANGSRVARLNYIEIARLDQQASRFTAAADACIQGDRARRDVNGTGNYIPVQELSGSSHGSIGVLGFTVPLYKNPISAALSVYVRDWDVKGTGNKAVQLYAIDGYTFSERELTWENSKLVTGKKNGISITDKAALIGSAQVSGEDSICRFDVTDYLQSRASQTLTFLVVSPSGSGVDLVLYAREKGVNPPCVEVFNEKEGIEQEGYLSSPQLGQYALSTVDAAQYSLISAYVDLSAYVGVNVRVSGFVDPDWVALTGEENQIVVQTIEVIAPPGKPGLSVPSWDNTGYPLWKWSTPEGASSFRYRLDGGGWQETTQNAYVPPARLSEGSHTLELECRNKLSAWSTTVSASVKVDLSAPRITTMQFTNPTNNQTPTLKWTAQDNYTVQAELLYQYRVDDREWVSSIQRTYTVTSLLEEGFHTFHIMARDLAGNWSQAASSVIEIDLTPPQEVTDFGIYYNDGHPRLDWTDSVSPDIDHYVISRDPSFLSTVKVDTCVQEYTDETVHMAGDQVYTYTIRGVDKATNVSSGTSASDGVKAAVSAGSAETQEVGAGNVQVSFAPGTLSKAITVVIKKVDAPVAAHAGGPQVGPVYHFEPEGVEFLAPIMLRFQYDTTELDASNDEKYLGVSYFDAVRSRWVRVPTVVDTATHSAVAFTNHFSEYALRVDTTDAYEGEGINPFGEYYANKNEQINEGTGGLSVVMPLASIPGARGNDLQLNMLYSSDDCLNAAQNQVARNRDKVNKLLSDYYADRSSDTTKLDSILSTNATALPSKEFYLGSGWSLDIPQIVNSTIYFPGGSAYSLFLGQDVHSGIHFSSERIENSTEIKVTMSNGYSYYFDGSAYFAPHTAKSDSSEDYVKQYYEKLKEYTTGNSISMNDLQTAYSYAFNTWTSKKGTDWDSEETDRVAKLTKITDPFGNVVNYSYTLVTTSTFGLIDKIIKISNQNDSIEYRAPLKTHKEFTRQ